jgi:AraC-like DNA-binding protein
MTCKMPAPDSASDAESALAALFTASRFEELHTGLSIWGDAGPRGVWAPKESVLGFEIEHRSELGRWAYNDRCITRARRERRPVLGLHAGFHDLFVAVPGSDRLVLGVGPFARRWPTSVDIAQRWRAVARSSASLSDSSFSRYLSASLSVLTLDEQQYKLFEAFIVSLAELLSGRGNVERLSAEQDELKDRLLAARKCERVWESARAMLDDRTAAQWLTELARDPLAALGLKRAPKHAVVGLLRPLAQGGDPIDDALRRHAFQRHVTEAMLPKEIVVGQVGDQGLALLAAFGANGARARTALLEAVRRAGQSARDHGFRLHAGIALAAASASLPERYRSALAAADTALSRGVAVVLASDQADASTSSLAELRATLAESVAENPKLLGIRFERYVEAVVARAGYQLDATRAYLESGLDRALEPLLSSGQLDARGLRQIMLPLSGARKLTNSIVWIDAYRTAIAEVVRTLETPTAARRARSVQRALSFMREHLGESLTLPQVARVGGFGADHFSRILRRAQGQGFERLLLEMRLERARHLLTSTNLRVAQIAQLTGFKSRPHFQQAFKRNAAATPLAYRAATRKG